MPFHAEVLEKQDARAMMSQVMPTCMNKTSTDWGVGIVFSFITL